MYGTGNYTLHALVEWCKANNLRGNLGKEIVLSNIQKILTNPFYVGLMRYRGEIFEGTHKPLISKKLFDKCQDVRIKRGKDIETGKHTFAFLGLLKCASCGSSITAEMQKGHAYYRCTKKGGECQEKHYLREEQLTEQIISFLKKVSLSSEDTEKVLAAFDAEQDKARDEARGEIDVLKSEVLKIEAKLSKLLDAYLADALTQPEYAAKKEQLLSRKVELNETIKDFADKGLSWLEPAREFVLSLNQATKLLESGDTKSMTTFLKNIGSNHILRNREFSFVSKLPYELAAEPAAGDSQNLPFLTVCAC
jgi:hypothetical protein